MVDLIDPSKVLDPPEVTIVDGRLYVFDIEIKVRDIIKLVNFVATTNGYAPMHTIDSDRPNPDWIYPGNVFVLPNETGYTVIEGDTLWDITIGYMVARLRLDYEYYQNLIGEYEDATSVRQDEIIEQLEQLIAESHVENLAAMVAETVQKWQE